MSDNTKKIIKIIAGIVILIFCGAYTIWPFDLVPDVLPPITYLDDGAIDLCGLIGSILLFISSGKKPKKSEENADNENALPEDSEKDKPEGNIAAKEGVDLGKE